MREATHEFLRRLVADHKKINYCTDPYKAAALKGIRIIKGCSNRASAGPPAVIVLAEDHYVERSRFTIFHEINHVEMQRFGLEEAIAARSILKMQTNTWKLSPILAQACCSCLSRWLTAP